MSAGLQEPAVASSSPRTGAVLHPRVWVVLLALLAFLAAAGASLALTERAPTVFGSSTTLTLDQPLVVASSTDPGPVEKLNRLRLQYAALLRTGVVAELIEDRTGVAARQVPEKVSAVPTGNSLLITVTARDDDPEQARELAAGAAAALIEYSERTQVRAGVPEKQRVELSVVTSASPGLPLSRGTRSAATVALFLGLVAAAIVYVLASLLPLGARDR